VGQEYGKQGFKVEAVVGLPLQRSRLIKWETIQKATTAHTKGSKRENGGVMVHWMRKRVTVPVPQP
jgi:hypothetical protein